MKTEKNLSALKNEFLLGNGTSLPYQQDGCVIRENMAYKRDKYPCICLGSVYYMEYEHMLCQVRFKSIKKDLGRNACFYADIAYNGNVVEKIMRCDGCKVYDSVDDYRSNNPIEYVWLSEVEIFNYFTKGSYHIGYSGGVCFKGTYRLYRWEWDGTKAVYSKTSAFEEFEKGWEITSLSPLGLYVGNGIQFMHLFKQAMSKTYYIKEMCEQDNEIQVSTFLDCKKEKEQEKELVTIKVTKEIATFICEFCVS